MSSTPTKRPPNPKADSDLERQMREMNEALLLSSVKQHELTEQAEKVGVALAQNLELLRQSHAYIESIVATVREPLLVLDGDLRVRTASRSFYEIFRVVPEDTENRLVYDLGNGQWNIPDLRRLLEEMLPHNDQINDYEIAHDFEHIGTKTMLLNARRLVQAADQSPLILLAIQDITARKQAVEALVESEERFRTLFELGPVAIFACDREGVIQDYNLRAAELWRREPERGHPDERYCGSFKLFYPDGRILPHSDSPIVEVLRSGTKVEGAEVVIERPDGSRIPVIVNFAPLKDPDGEVVGAVTSFVDITERKKAETEIQALSDYNRNVLESITDPVFTLDREWRFMYMSRKGEEMVFHQPGELLGKSIWEEFPGVIGSPFEKIYRDAMDDGITGTVTDYFPDHDRWYEVTAYPSSNGVTVYFRNLTESKQAEETLRSSEENFRTLADSISQLAWMTDAEGWIYWYNERWFEYTGTTLEEMQGWAWQRVHHPSMVKRVTKKFKRHIASGEDWEDTFLLRGANGEYRWFLSRAVPIRNDEGKIIRWFGTNTDIDEVRRAEDILRLSREELEMRVDLRTAELADANASLKAQVAERQRAQEERIMLLKKVLTTQEEERRRIARDMHDHFGQQLTALRLQLELLEKMCVEDAMCEKVGETKEIAKQLDSDVSFLVWELRPTALDDLGLKDALAHYIEKWTAQFETPAEFHVHDFDGTPLSDEAQTCLYRIAQEALNNTYKYANATQASVLLNGKNGAVEMIIEDNGIGFDTNKNTNRRKGLGIIGMHERAALVGGTVEIESQPDKGTTIFVRIPLKEEPAGGGGAKLA